MKNVVLISIDSLRADALACCGNEQTPTPNIDQLAQRGTLFNSAISQAPYTVGSHASMLTGLYPFNHGLRRQYMKSKLPRSSLHPLNKIKQDHKLLAFTAGEFFGQAYGYDIWDFHTKSKILTIKNAFRRYRNTPFFAFVHYWAVHTPYATNLAENLWQHLAEQVQRLVKNDYISLPRVDRILFGGDSRKIERIRSAIRSKNDTLIGKVKQGYRKAVTRADRFVGQILQSLEALGLLSQTAIILTADHGESFNEYNEIHQFPNHYEHGYCLYDNVIRVPLIITDFASNLSAGKTIEQQVRIIDIMPTILDILGKAQFLSPKNVNGKSLLKYINQQTEQSSVICPHAYSETMQDPEYEANVEKVSIRTNDGYKLIFDCNKNEGILVNYKENEKQDIKQNQPDIFRKLKSELANLIETSKIHVSDDQESMDKQEYDKIAKSLKDLGYL